MDFSWTAHRFAGGALALDVANSVILRHEPERRRDRFAVVVQRDEFAAAASELSAERSLFGRLQPVDAANVQTFLHLREAIDCYFRARTQGNDERKALADLLALIAKALRLAPSENSLECATARSALRLLGEPAAERMKICGNCGWLFLDRSKNRSRYWCDMAVCGNRAKASRHYHRRKDGAP
ncbi:CGNR zinc finger domain-containing protein [Rhizobium sp. 18065]|uniref:CGNR zinc finger domain-containing protein n=1 Tax=Rhizobium sp. 18065 TaxID=2681411 RepID=UPI00135744C1|nr:CGNR zinc finger domain-containing protein [Rhizobium sp. 18065]